MRLTPSRPHPRHHLRAPAFAHQHQRVVHAARRAAASTSNRIATACRCDTAARGAGSTVTAPSSEGGDAGDHRAANDQRGDAAAPRSTAGSRAVQSASHGASGSMKRGPR